MPTARRAGQAQSRCELQRRRRFPPRHNRYPGPPAQTRRYLPAMAGICTSNNLGHRAVAPHAQCPPIPLTPGQQPGTTASRMNPMTAGYHAGNVTDGQHAPNADYFALSVLRFAARWVLQINLLCVLGEVISEREATWYTVSARFCRVDRSGCRAGLNTPPNGLG